MRSNEILTAVIHGARKEEPSSEVQRAAINALYNSLEFVRDNFDREVCHIYYFVPVHVSCSVNNRASATISCRSFVRPHRARHPPYKLALSNAWSVS